MLCENLREKIKCLKPEESRNKKLKNNITQIIRRWSADMYNKIALFRRISDEILLPMYHHFANKQIHCVFLLSFRYLPVFNTYRTILRIDESMIDTKLL